MTAARDYSELHALIDRLSPSQADEVQQHVLRLVKPLSSRFSVLRTFDGPATNLGARAKEVLRQEFGGSGADR
ncbi:hypothetical protein D5S18_09175 [Nocardia panacis]|uniref:Uncharacterized protein n=1 Tax=Nocardia panacis TaxID=2340916 RepID=A0A3A4KIN9_9NOCA|nr:hypothetical protein [Nocardia panacis]RJO76474.1 hypothetical protein D5S18_09175 [Nocardia panacis]